MLHRPYIRSSTRAEVENRAEKNENGQFLDANTGKPIEKSYDLGHKPGHEFRYEKAQAEREGLTQKEFNDRMNNPDYYQIEDPASNRSHKFEMKTNPYENINENNVNENSAAKTNSVGSTAENIETNTSMESNVSSESSASETANIAGESTSSSESASNSESSGSGEANGGGEEEGQSM